MMRRPDTPITDFEYFLLRKIVIPLMLISFAYFIFLWLADSRRCQSACEIKGYDDSRFFPSVDISPARCTCLKEENHVKEKLEISLP